jgi:D-aminopeptidase
MKVFISSDIEGTAGIVDWQQVRASGADYELGRRLLTDEVNAAIDGAVAASAVEILVNDSHSTMQKPGPGRVPSQRVLPVRQAQAPVHDGGPRRHVRAIELPATLPVTFLTADMAEMSTWIRGVGARVVTITDDEPLRLYRDVRQDCRPDPVDVER